MSDPIEIEPAHYHEDLYEALDEASHEDTRSKAIDHAVAHYCRAAGGSITHPTGTYEELMELAIEQGSVTPEEIADILDNGHLPVKYDCHWSVNDREDFEEKNP